MFLQIIATFIQMLCFRKCGSMKVLFREILRHFPCLLLGGYLGEEDQLFLKCFGTFFNESNILAGVGAKRFGALLKDFVFWDLLKGFFYLGK